MVSHKQMLDLLEAWEKDPALLTLREISRRAGRNDSNTRRILVAMLECGMLESCPVPDPSGKKAELKGYRPVVRPPILDQSYIDQSL